MAGKKRRREAAMLNRRYSQHIRSEVIPYICSAGDKIVSADGDIYIIKQVLPAVIAGDKPKLMVNRWLEEGNSNSK